MQSIEWSNPLKMILLSLVGVQCQKAEEALIIKGVVTGDDEWN